jgi:hypothetical protein
MHGLRVRSCLIDGEIVVIRSDGVSCFERLRHEARLAVSLDMLHEPEGLPRPPAMRSIDHSLSARAARKA